MLDALSFTSPLILGALALLPIIWLLLRATPPAPRRINFPAFEILRQLKTSDQTPDKTPWWLLLLRLLLAAFVILGLAGPVLNAPAPTPGAGPLVIVIDDTWAAAQNWTARRDAIREAAADAQQNDREIFMITTAPQRTPAELSPMTGSIARSAADALTPAPFAAERGGVVKRLDDLDPYLENEPAADIRWLSDGVISEGDAALAKALSERGNLSVMVDRSAPKIILRALGQSADGPRYRIERLDITGSWEGALTATARDGRELLRLPVHMAAGEKSMEETLDLPLALRNELSAVRIENAASAGATQLIDARDRRALIGLIADPDRGRSNLLSGAHYVRQALNPYAEFLEDSLNGILASDASVIVLDDIGHLRASEVEALLKWVEGGGVLIRFAGPVLAEAAQDETPPLLPVPLRGGGRAFGGALTWETPQPLDAFSGNGPFSGLRTPDDVFVRRQVLAQPGGETTERTWARLKDGTPLVTGARQGAGVIALFHVTATPDWSDLPISGVFVDMLRRLTFLSALGPENAEDAASARYAPLRLMDGFGRMRRPADEDLALTAAELSLTPAPDRTPGFYGPPEAPLALNAVGAETPFAPITLAGVSVFPYEATPPAPLSPPLFLAALILLIADAILTLFISGKLNLRVATAMITCLLALSLTAPSEGMAQPLDPEIDNQTADAALTTRLAYVQTGDREMDKLSAQALAALSRELVRRTAIEPAPPAGVNLDKDDLSVYPFLYWPIVPGAEAPSDAALANIENFMRFGGLILFDTRDDERAVAAGSTPEAQALQHILAQLNIPPLTPVGANHVLTRSFYLMGDLTGRVNNNPVWVQADASGANDGVTPIIIGGRDWAGAWATDSFSRPLRPIGRGGARTRELAYRAGVNIVMVAFTGNYKSDQVHTPILLERLGQ